MPPMEISSGSTCRHVDARSSHQSLSRPIAWQLVMDGSVLVDGIMGNSRPCESMKNPVMSLQEMTRILRRRCIQNRIHDDKALVSR